jgi:hypothetical protein
VKRGTWVNDNLIVLAQNGNRIGGGVNENDGSVGCRILRWSHEICYGSDMEFTAIKKIG